MNSAETESRTWAIRRAVAEDAVQLSEVAARIFYDTFAEANTPEDMDLYCSQTFTPGLMAGEIRDADTDVLVACGEGALIAYTQLHRGDAPAVAGPAPAVELKRFYVLRAWHGTGLAHDLMRAAAEAARGHGAVTLWLGVWEHNARAIRFYNRLGFNKVGEQPFILGNDLQRDLIMAAPVTALRLPGNGE